MPKEIQKVCATCYNDDDYAETPCTHRRECFTPEYEHWEERGSEKQDTGCSTCPHWSAVKIGKFCPDCGQGLK